MEYTSVCTGIFLRRPNRFLAEVMVEGESITVHVRNTGRCEELLVPGCHVVLAAADNPERQTAWDLVAVWKEREQASPLLINLDAGAPNEAAAEWLPHSGLFPAGAEIEREVTFGDSRFDFKITAGETISFLEVKGVTLEENGIAKFPDAPTERGAKHLRELAACKAQGYGAYLLFVIQMEEASKFEINTEMDPEFNEALHEADAQGVIIHARNCAVTPSSMSIRNPVQILL